MSALTDADLAMFAAFHIPAELVHLHRIERVTDQEARENHGIKGEGDMAGIAFPYLFVPNSNGDRVTSAVRRDHPPVVNGKEDRKYVRAWGDAPHLYFPCNSIELADPATTVVFVEAQKSCLAVTAWALRNKYRIVCIAVGGTQGWRCSKHESRYQPDLACVTGHKIVILFDTNVAFKADLEAHRSAFKEVLLRNFKAASVLTPNLPTYEREGVNGPDDFLKEFDDQALVDVLHEPSERVGVVMVEETTLEDMDWLWPNRIPRGYLSVVSGNPDTGKTTIMLDLVSRYTTGRAWPDEQPNTIEPGYALLMIAEDGASDVIKPRLVAAEADCKRIGIMHAKIPTGNKTERYFTLDEDLERLERTIKAPPYFSLVAADPLSSYLGKADLNKEMDVRRVLGPIKEMCARTGVTFLALGHFNKRSDVSALGAVSGAVANTGLPRAVFLCMKDSSPTAEAGDMLMLLGKGNLTKRRTGLRYRFREVEVTCDNGKPNFVPVIDWRGEETKDADEVRDDARNPEARASAKAERFLREFLKDDEKPSSEIFEAAKKVGLKPRTLHTVKKELGIKAVKRAGVWWWQPLNA